MTRQELSVFLGGWFCGCGQPEEACKALLRLLRLHPLYDHRVEFEEWVPDPGIRLLLLYTVSDRDLAEHGGSVGGQWLTAKGKALLAALEAEEVDGFETLCEARCAHGFPIDGDEGPHDCMAAEGRS